MSRVFGRRVPQRQQHASGALVIVLERQRACEREHIALCRRGPNGGSAERIDRLVDVAGAASLLAASKPLGGVAKGHLTVAGRDGARDEEGGDRKDDQRDELEDLAVDERRPLVRTPD